MELTLGGHGIALRNLSKQVEDKADRIVRQVHWPHTSEQHRDHQKELLEASGTRYVSPLR